MLGSIVTSGRYVDMLRAARSATNPWLTLDPAVVARDYNRMPFLMQHRLAGHPAFTLEALSALCQRLPTGNVLCRSGVVPKDTHFDTSLPRFRADLSVAEAFEQLEAKQLYIAVYNPERDPEYKVIIEGLLGEIAAATDPIEHAINWYSTYIFVSAHDSLTPYHMDREMNFLMQVRGRKTVRLWDPQDDAVMTPAERDHLFATTADARPTYRPELDALAHRFELEPGFGVHHPFIAPHLVYTGPELSISLAITFRTPRSDMWSDAYRFNERLMRRIGLSAGRVGESESLDRTKALAINAAKRFKRAVLKPRATSSG
jgi:Cupin-like domain